MDSDNRKTIEAYEAGVNAYNAAATPEVTGDSKEWIDAGLALLPNAASILELGSAHGRDADYMEARGFNVDRTDAARGFVEYMRHKGHSARELNALTDNYGGPYHMVYANAVLLHFTEQQIEEVLTRVRQALKDEGLFSFSVKIGDGSEWTATKLGLPRYFSYWHEEQIRILFDKARLKVIYWEEG